MRGCTTWVKLKSREHASSLMNVYNVQHMQLTADVFYLSNFPDECNPEPLIGYKLKWASSLHYDLQTMPTSHATFTWDMEKPTPVKPAGTASGPSATGETCLKRFEPHRLL